MNNKQLLHVQRQVLDHGHTCEIDNGKLKIGIVWYDDSTKQSGIAYEYASTVTQTARILGY